MPTLAEEYAQVEPVCEEWPGWQVDTADVKTRGRSARECARYIARLEELIGVEFVLIGVGPGAAADGAPWFVR